MYPSQAGFSHILWLIMELSLVENDSTIWSFGSFMMLEKEASLIPVVLLIDTSK